MQGVGKGAMVSSVDPDSVRLRAELATLRAGLEARTQENALLFQMLTDVISTLKLDQVLRHIVDHLVTVMGCHGAFIYLWDEARQRLVLRGASERYQHMIGRIELAQGEGLVGWSALTRKPAMVRERALEDPRFHYFPELQEELFQAILTVPMTGADGSVVAVISMHTVAPQEFTEEHVRLVAAMAPILGGAIATSDLYEQTVRKLTVLSTLSSLVQTVRSGSSLDEALRTLAETTARVTASDLCLLILQEPGHDRLSVRAYLPSGEDSGDAVAHTASLSRQPWEFLASSLSPAQVDLQAALPATLDLQGPYARITAPLVAAGDQLGLLACYRLANRRQEGTPPRRYAGDDSALLNIIANQIAIAVKNKQLAELLAERDVPARLFRDLVQGSEEGTDLALRRAAVLGCDLTKPHLPLVIGFAAEPGRGESRQAAYQTLGGVLRRWLADTYPGSLVHVDAAVLAVVRISGQDALDGFIAAFETLQTAVERRFGTRLVAGMGRICLTPGDYRRGFAEAREALRVGRSLRRRGGVVAFESLGAARYLSRLPSEVAADEVQDRYQEGLARVASYDARKGTTLIETLEAYLACGGNIARAAERLFVHRNTLVQRLEKLHELLGLDPHESDHWLALHIALKLQTLAPRRTDGQPQ